MKKSTTTPVENAQTNKMKIKGQFEQANASQVTDTSGGEMPDPLVHHGPSENEVRETFKKDKKNSKS